MQNPSPFKPAIVFAMLDAAGLRSADVARRLHVSEPTVCNWRKGVHSMSAEHYTALIQLAASFETTWLALHRTLSKQAPREEPIPGFEFHVQAFAGDYKAQMHQSFQACLETLRSLSETPSDWDYERLCAVTEELRGMARALKIIMQAEEKQDAPV